MMQLTTFLDINNIYYNVPISNKKQALEFLGKAMAEILNNSLSPTDKLCIHPAECFSYFFKREKLGSTGINNGVALPHAKLLMSQEFQLEKPIAIFLKLEAGINFESIDHKDVDIIYAIFFSEKICVEYKDSLREIAQQLSDKNLLKHLRAALSREEIWQILSYYDYSVNKNLESRNVMWN